MSGSNLRIGRLTCVPHADTAIGAGGEEEPSARRVAQLDPLIDGTHQFSFRRSQVHKVKEFGHKL